MGLLSWLRGDRAELSDSPDTTNSPDSPGATHAVDATHATHAVDAVDATDMARGAARDASAPERPVAGWRELPPMQRAVTAPGLVTDPEGFRSSLSSWQDTTLTTPLGHLVSPQAPSGLMHGLVASSGPTTVSRDADGRGEGVVVASWPTAAGRIQAQAQPAAVPLQRSAALDSMVSAGTSPAELPVRQLVGERPVEPSLSQPSERSGVSRPSGTYGPSGSPEPSATPPIPAMPSATALSGSASPPVRDSSRTPGLGAPLTGLPSTAQRQIAARAPRPTAESNEPTGPGSDSGPGSSSDAETPARPLLGDAPSLVQRQAQHVHRHTAPPSPDRAPVPIQRLDGPDTLRHHTGHPTETASGPVARLVAQRAVPLFATGPDAPTASLMASVSGGTEPEPPVVPVRWSAPHPEAAVQRSYGAGDRAARTAMAPTSTHAPPAVQRQQQGPRQGQGQGQGQKQGQGQGQPQTFGGPPPPRSVSGSLPGPAPAFRDAGSVAVAAGVAQRMADGSVVFGGPATARTAGAAQVLQAAQAVQPAQAAQPARSVQPAQSVQRQAMTGDTPPEPIPEPTPIPKGSEGSEESEGTGEPASDPDPAFPDGVTAVPPGAMGSAAAGSSANGSPPVTDELVRALYAPLSRLLKADLRLERERAGFLINTRH
ncbi:hypothetical protein ACFRR7_17250 [Streptomyces sp. NPDC056909]|uniref:hypothetical protein n=1 Tax=Streptomyces sp. NPDC056909 TaxID=3345963 RepID=UPI003680F7D3